MEREPAERGARPADAAVRALTEYDRGFASLRAALTADDVPEVGLNVAYAPEGARGPDDVIGLAGRVVLAGRTGGIAQAGEPRVGAPGHTGRIALALQRVQPGPWWVLNHRFDERFLANARAAGLVLGEFHRADEPPGASGTMEWGTLEACKALGRVPDGVFDRGAWGKEPMIRLFARDAPALLAKLRAVQGLP